MAGTNKRDVWDRGMRYLLIALILLFSAPATAVEYHLEWSAGFFQPHGEAVVGAYVARYQGKIKPEIEFDNFRLSSELTAWGLQTWQPSSVVGHGVPDAWENSDWTVEEWRYSSLTRVEVGPDKIFVFIENYMPFDRHQWKGHGHLDNYYWLGGVGGRFE